MNNKYNAQRSRNLFRSNVEKPFKLSRSKIEDFLYCPRCFYLDRKCGTDQPPSFPFTLNTAVDTLLKKEFDKYRTEGTAHPLLIKHGIDAIPFFHPDLDDWRMNFKGIQHLHEPTNFIITGAIDDLWINSKGELIVADYKATSTSKEIVLRQALKNQIELYQWLLRQKGFAVSSTGYFVYCNADTMKEGFEGKLEFEISLIPYEGDDSWIAKTLGAIRECLVTQTIPTSSGPCDFCAYLTAVRSHLTNG